MSERWCCDVTSAAFWKLIAHRGLFPIGIDVEKIHDALCQQGGVSHPDVSRLAAQPERGEKLAIGVDRLDYSKGLVNRINAFDRMWTALHPALARTVSLLQIAHALARRDRSFYAQSAERTAAKLVSDVNGRHGEGRLRRSDPLSQQGAVSARPCWPGLYRTHKPLQVGVVTPLHDGMNLVAKEYVAAQNPDDPGVLVLSKFAGAANELDTALLVNPHDIDGMARTIAVALSMPFPERRMRWEAMMAKLRCRSIQQWFTSFVEALETARAAREATAQPIESLPAPWALRSVNA